MKKKDFEIWDLIRKEKKRQQTCINLIASENYASKAVMQAQGSYLTNKYAEGYINKRFYGGCEVIDKIEQLAIDRAKKLFNADYVNVQPHSGSQANFAIFQALLQPHDVIIGLHLSHGGHLTHGSQVNFSGKLYKSYYYTLDISEQLDYSNLENLCKKYKPKMIIGGFSAYSRICNWKKMRVIADKVGAYLMVDISHISGLIIAGLYPSPLKYAHVVSTTTHKTLGGPRGGLILSCSGSLEMYKKINAAVFPGSQGGPLMHVIAAKAIAFKEALQPEFIKIQKKTILFSQLMVDIFIKRKFRIVSGKTENHLFLIDLTKQNITGDKASNILSQANIIVNKNTIPFDVQNPFVTSGIRIGTPAIATRGFTSAEVIKITNWIADILTDYTNKELISKIKEKVKQLCSQHVI